MEMCTDELEIVCPLDPFLAIQVEVKRYPLFSYELLEPTLWKFAHIDSFVTATIYIHVPVCSNVLGSPEYILLGIADSSSLAGTLFRNLELFHEGAVTLDSWMGGRRQIEEPDALAEENMKYHIQDGVLWKHCEHDIWRSIGYDDIWDEDDNLR